MRSIGKFAIVLGASLCLNALAQTTARPNFGDPLPGLTTEQLDAFTGGRDAFEEVETPERGLGPIFNNVSCAACHFTRATGGSSTIVETRFGRVVNGRFDPLANLGGSLLQEFANDPAAQEIVPPQANIIA